MAAAGPYDALVVDDALARATQPLHLLQRLAPLLRAGGVAVVASSHAWDPAVTPRVSWLGGFKMNGEAVTSQRMLRHHMERAGFAFARAEDIPRMLRHNARSFALDVLDVAAFVKSA